MLNSLNLDEFQLILRVCVFYQVLCRCTNGIWRWMLLERWKGYLWEDVAISHPVWGECEASKRVLLAMQVREVSPRMTGVGYVGQPRTSFLSSWKFCLKREPRHIQCVGIAEITKRQVPGPLNEKDAHRSFELWSECWVNDLVMASFTHGKITNFHPAKIISTVLNRGAWI